MFHSKIIGIMFYVLSSVFVVRERERRDKGGRERELNRGEEGKEGR